MISALPFDVFAPDGDDARRWAEEELSKGIYDEAKPTWFDQLAANIFEAIIGLFRGDGSGGVAPIAITVAVIIVVAALVVALLVWGRPRSTARIRRRTDLLGERDDRTSAQLRDDADRRARNEEWDLALVLRFRALARALLERDLLDPAPGATAQAIAREACGPFPGFADRLHAAAVAFDSVRYLGIPAERSDYEALTATDRAIAAATPVSLAPAGIETAVPA